MVFILVCPTGIEPARMRSERIALSTELRTDKARSEISDFSDFAHCRPTSCSARSLAIYNTAFFQKCQVPRGNIFPHKRRDHVAVPPFLHFDFNFNSNSNSLLQISGCPHTALRLLRNAKRESARISPRLFRQTLRRLHRINV